MNVDVFNSDKQKIDKNLPNGEVKLSKLRLGQNAM